MIRYQITGSNPIEMNTAAKLLIEHPRLDVDQDSGNRNTRGKPGAGGRKDGYIRYVHVRVKHKSGKPKPKPRPKLDGAQKMVLANQCWQRIVHKTDSDEDAVEAIVKLIEYVERLYLNGKV